MSGCSFGFRSRDFGGGGRGGFEGTLVARARASSSEMSFVAGDTEMLANRGPKVPGTIVSGNAENEKF